MNLNIIKNNIRILILSAIIILMAMIFFIPSIPVMAVGYNPYFTWNSNTVSIGGANNGLGQEYFGCDGFGLTTIHFDVLTNYSLNGVTMPAFKVTGEKGDINGNPNINEAHLLGAQMYYAEVDCIKFVGVNSGDCVGWYIHQSIPDNHDLVYQYDYGIAGSINTPETPPWAHNILGNVYNDEAFCIYN